MYPRNSATPPRIAIGAVVQISDGAIQTSGCTVRVIEEGGSEGDGAGTTAYSTDGVVLYTPTQAETDQATFLLIAKKTGCIPVSQTVVTTDVSTELAKVPKSDGTSTWNATALASIQTEAQDAITASALATAANLATVAGYLDTEIAAILEDTGTTLPALIADLPTVAEFEARTLAAASYFDPAIDTVANVTNVAAATLADGAHGGAAAALTLKSISVVNSDPGGTAFGIVANGAGGTGLLVDGAAADIIATLPSVTIAAGGIPVGAFSAGAITDAATAADAEAAIAAAVLAGIVEAQGSYTVKQALSICLAVLAGVTADGGATIKTPNGVATRVSATVSGANERTAMTVTP